uniref:Gustatory receptor n=1 Tax=Anopheles maculatus TaxID=74869 RepID=A0A182S5W9_9DIPT
MVLLFCIHFNLLLSYATGLVPFRYNFRRRRFVPCKPCVPAATVLLLLFAGVQYKLGRLPERMKIPKVGMQDIIHTVENLVLNGNCVLIAVQQLRFLGTYRRLLTDLLANARTFARLGSVGRFAQVQLLAQLVLLPCAVYALHTFVYLTLMEPAEFNIVHAILFMVSLIPNIAHVNNFYALLFVQRLTLGEINDKLANLWTICIRHTTNQLPASVAELLPAAHHLQHLLEQYQQCAGTLQTILQQYSLTFFYQFTHFYTLSMGNPSPFELEAMGTMMILVYGLDTAQLIANCYAISEQMVAAISNFVVLLMQFHIEYSKSKLSYWHNHNVTKPLKSTH